MAGLTVVVAGKRVGVGRIGGLRSTDLLVGDRVVVAGHPVGLGAAGIGHHLLLFGGRLVAGPVHTGPDRPGGFVGTGFVGLCAHVLASWPWRFDEVVFSLLAPVMDPSGSPSSSVNSSW
jgi:hypothetical protein